MQGKMRIRVLRRPVLTRPQPARTETLGVPTTRLLADDHETVRVPMTRFLADDHEIECPHCGGMLLIRASDINCTIFRHGVWKHTNEPIGPHTSKGECDRLVAEDLIRGCGRPFKFDGRTVTVCDYI